MNPMTASAPRPAASPRRLRRACGAGLLLAAAFAGCDPRTETAPAIGEITPVASPAGAGSGMPQLTTAPDGRVLLSWLEPVGERVYALRLSILQDGGWSAPTTVVERPDFFVNWADFPSAVALPDGRLAVHWLERIAEATYAYGVRVAQSLDGGRTWSAPVTPHRDTSPQEHGFVTLFARGDSLAAVWLDGRNFEGHEGHHGEGGAEMMLLYTTIAADGSLGPELALDTRVCDCCQTAAAHTDAGPVVVYRDRSPEEIRDISIVRLRDGAWTAPQAVHADGWHITGCPVNGPAIAAEGSQVAVAWFTAAQDTARVRVAFSDDDGASFTPPLRVDDGDPIGRVDVVMLDDGSALVSWLERTEDGAEVRVRSVNRTGRLTPAQTVAASEAARASGFPRMTRLGDEVWFAWTMPGERSQVHLARAAVERR
jgi:hypothetical protein